MAAHPNVMPPPHFTASPAKAIFIGCVGGWIRTIFGLDSLLLASMLAACVALFFFKAGAIPLLLACAIAGLVVSYFH